MNTFTALATIASAGIAAYGLLLFTSYILWDGWGYSHWLGQVGQLPHIQQLFREIGRPMDELFWMPFVGVRDMHAPAKIAGLSAWIVTSCLMYLVLLKSRFAPPPAALLCSLLAAALPVFDVLGELAIWMNTACVALFWAAWYLVVSMPAEGVLRWMLRVFALMAFFLSFNLNSLLVFFYAVALCLVLSPAVPSGFGSIAMAVRKAIFRYVDFAILPIAFWLWKKVFTPNSGHYEGYNNPSLSLEILSRTGGSLFDGFIAGELKALFESPLWVVATLVVVLLAALSLQRLGAKLPAVGTAKVGLMLVLSGSFLLIAGAFPYAVVDQSFSSFGWLSRNCILFPLPLGMIIVGGFTLLGAKAAAHRPGLVWLAVAFVALLAVGSSNRTILRLQAFGEKQESVARKLRASFADAPPAFVQLRDYFLIPKTIYFYPPIVWTYLMARGLQIPRTFVVETSQMAPDQVSLDSSGVPQRRITVLDVNRSIIEAAVEQTTMPYAMTQIPRHGRQALAVVEPGDFGEDGVRIGWQALKTRWLQPSEMPDFLERLTRVQVRDLPSIPAE